MSSDSCVGERKLLPVFKKLAKQNSILTLSNSYHGIVRFQDSRILWVNPECAVMKVKDCKTFSAPGGQIQLHNSAFARPVKATLRELNYQEGLLYLSGFSYSDREWQTRYHERVQPKNPAYAILNFNRHSLRAFIENISLNGQGLIIDKKYLSDSKMKLWSKVSLRFNLPPNYEWNGLNAMVVNQCTLNNCLVRLGLLLRPTSQESRLLVNYVTARKQEILDELGQEGFEESVPNGVERLYF